MTMNTALADDRAESETTEHPNPCSTRPTQSYEACSNTNAMVQHSVNGIAFSDNFEDKDELIHLMASFGKNVVVEEDGMDNITAVDRKSTRLNSSHSGESRMPSSA